MEKEKIVVDASIVVKWFLREKHYENALKLRDDYVRGVFTIAVPSLMKYEVLNALKYSKVYSLEELTSIGIALNKYGFKVYDLQGELKTEVITLAIKNQITIYDASYVALARVLTTVLYTADEELVRKFPKTAVHIREYSLNRDKLS